jgi:hypothetical protein
LLEREPTFPRALVSGSREVWFSDLARSTGEVFMVTMGDYSKTL